MLGLTGSILLTKIMRRRSGNGERGRGGGEDG
jgi:hypothetical protein